VVGEKEVEVKHYIVIQEGWDPTPDPLHSRPAWLNKDHLAERYGLDWRAGLRCTIAWNPRRHHGCPVPYESAVILGPRFSWDYRLPEAAESVLVEASRRFMQGAVDRAWPVVLKALQEKREKTI
jgi:hypothetical protein